MTRYWIGVASKEHVQRGVLGGFAQVCHGKAGPLNRMKEGDWIIYYSPNNKFKQKEPCQSFTAIGQIKYGDPYSFAMSEDFIPWRRNVSFIESCDVPIQQLLEELSFIKDTKKWGFPFRRGCFEISQRDFQTIAKAMGV
ncbi:MAG: EVE domain-containing protein [Simkaniaceae bacterium]|nr:EVE domain-containing protein [Candidatus Sacchlamyda saccharinae]